MLLSDHKDGLDTETVRKLRVIRENAQKMGLLIDDLLDFSRLGQNSLHFSRVNMENIVDEIWAELREIYPDRKMELLKNDLPTASGDYHLLKLVVQNLLSNAAKFSKFWEITKIEVGGSRGVDETVFYFKDNGAGFDMRFYDKLFGIFQRLHSEDEYEGTGVGLANVQRVIHRHGGRVWAEGKVDQGATFYFSLPSESENLAE